MKHFFSINAEGGPLLLAEAGVARQWKGTFEDGADYRTLCLAFDSNPQVPGMPFPVGNGKGIAWEMAGSGTADVFKGRDGEILVFRAWLSEDTPEALQQLIEVPGTKQVQVGHLEVSSQKLAIFWAAESGKGISTQVDGEYQKIKEHTAIEGSVFVLEVSCQSFICIHDEVVHETARARRLMLIPLK